MPLLATSQRFHVKEGMRLWTNIDYSHPELATLVAEGGDDIDEQDEDAFNLLLLCPELSHTGDTP